MLRGVSWFLVTYVWGQILVPPPRISLSKKNTRYPTATSLRRPESQKSEILNYTAAEPCSRTEKSLIRDAKRTIISGFSSS